MDEAVWADRLRASKNGGNESSVCSCRLEWFSTVRGAPCGARWIDLVYKARFDTQLILQFGRQRSGLYPKVSVPPLPGRREQNQPRLPYPACAKKLKDLRHGLQFGDIDCSTIANRTGFDVQSRRANIPLRCGHMVPTV